MVVEGRKRIALNAVVTYSRSILSVFFVLFSSRWALLELGEVDFGLYNIIGSVLLVIVFLNTVIGNGDARFLAVAIGKGNKEELNKLFNTIFSIHLIISFIVSLIGLFLGEYLISNVLNIPESRIDVTIIAFRFTLIASIVSMITAPYIGLFIAYQNIVEYTIITFLQTILVFCSAYSLRFINGDKFLWYSILLSVSQILTFLLIGFSARHRFSCSKWVFNYFFNKENAVSIFKFSFWNMLGDLGFLFRTQGIAFITNMYFGPVGNSALGIANQISLNASKLTNSITEAISPEMYKKYGEGKEEDSQRLGKLLSRIGVFAMMVMAVPILYNLDYILKIWLVNPPEGTNILCTCFILSFIIEKMAAGEHVYLHTINKIAWAETGRFFSFAMTVVFPFMGLLNLGILGIGISVILAMILSRLSIIYCSHKFFKYSYRDDILKLISQIILQIFIYMGIYHLCYKFFNVNSIIMLLLSCAIIVFFTIVISLYISFNADERKYICSYAKKGINKITSVICK